MIQIDSQGRVIRSIHESNEIYQKVRCKYRVFVLLIKHIGHV